MAYTYDFPRPSFTLDAAVLTIIESKLSILLIQRKHNPFEGKWALPGGFLEMDETLKTGSARELCEETGLENLDLSPVFTCGEPGRDPRSRTITQVFGVLVNSTFLAPKGGDDAAEARWFPVNSLPEMAFDHLRVISQIYDHIRWQAKTSIIGKNYFNFEADADSILHLHKIVSGVDDVQSPVERAETLGLLKKNKDGKYVYNIPRQSGPDYSTIVW
ncbi:MAG: NUDIX hydrolase [Candidatus Riflebacteria bacterium]|nr:NUDIX hydrolase [Candidatus Riflebacteria bacterium]